MYAIEADLNKSTCRKDPSTINLFISIYTLAKIINHREKDFYKSTTNWLIEKKILTNPQYKAICRAFDIQN